MARGINKVILIGNIGKDPISAAMPNGSSVCNFTLATAEEWRDKTTGEKQERVEWHRVTVFGKLAEVATSYLRKGTRLYVEGSLRTRKWNDNGVDRYVTEIVCSEFQMLDPKGASPTHQNDAHEEPDTGSQFDDHIPF